MILLDFKMDLSDIEHTESLLNELRQRSDDNSLLDIYAPLGTLEFIVNGKNMSWCSSTAPKEEIVAFARSLSNIVHRLKLGEEIKQPRIMNGGNRWFKLVEPDTVCIKTGSSTITQTQCSYSELKQATETFCRKLYEEISERFPDYFALMDLSMCGDSRIPCGEKLVQTLLQR
ncbi:MAG: hypothetical protein QG625_3799 [Cyanobacteriota bacterium erpe_2018_sw_39hr_WHONDRS-SW48-000098_B_bin.30]|jgi:hypothetical protein|nr:hypothetical protein [Candidatus Obscuribacter sp.]MBK9619449.1 hypothetical protein [Candidatus Obscuribacter sp.]MDQ5967642.1 hypothetical protein [Cyanobacteriota bacterium erpe_2018_sw_39hr_WHONDRS-SW48-000098_B_bin.30]